MAMFSTGGIQALKSYSSQARAGEILSTKRRIPNQPRLTGADNVDISGRSRAIAIAKSFTARLSQATQAAEPAVSQTVGSTMQSSAHIQDAIQLKKKEKEAERVGSNLETSVHIQEAIQLKKEEREAERVSDHELPKDAVVGFSTMTQESIEEATKEIEKIKEPPPDKFKTRISIDDFSLKFIRALNPIPA